MYIASSYRINCKDFIFRFHLTSNIFDFTWRYAVVCITLIYSSFPYLIYTLKMVGTTI